MISNAHDESRSRYTVMCIPDKWLFKTKFGLWYGHENAFEKSEAFSFTLFFAQILSAFYIEGSLDTIENVIS
jgi:hypothetical protein